MRGCEGLAGTHSIKLNLDISSALSTTLEDHQMHKVLKPAPNMVTHSLHLWLQWKRPSRLLFHWTRTGMGLTWYSCTLHPSPALLPCCHEPPPPAYRGGYLINSSLPVLPPSLPTLPPPFFPPTPSLLSFFLPSIPPSLPLLTWSHPWTLLHS